MRVNATAACREKRCDSKALFELVNRPIRAEYVHRSESEDEVIDWLECTRKLRESFTPMRADQENDVGACAVCTVRVIQVAHRRPCILQWYGRDAT